VGLDAGGITVHYESNSTRRGYACDLSVAEAVPLAQLEHAVALGAGGLGEVGGAGAGGQAGGAGGDPVGVFPGARVGGGGGVGGAVVADDPGHGVLVGVVAGEGPDLGGDLGGGGVGRRVHQGGQGGGLRPALGRVVGDALHHQERAEVGVAQPQGAEVVG